MRSGSHEVVVDVFDALEAAFKRALDLSFDVLTTPERLALLQRCEKLRRRLSAIENPLINQVAAQADPTELGGKLRAALANLLLISRGEASRRIHEAADLGPRRTDRRIAGVRFTGDGRGATKRRHRRRPRHRHSRFLAPTAERCRP
jgi:hypothetical protein